MQRHSCGLWVCDIRIQNSHAAESQHLWVCRISLPKHQSKASLQQLQGHHQVAPLRFFWLCSFERELIFPAFQCKNERSPYPCAWGSFVLFLNIFCCTDQSSVFVWVFYTASHLRSSPFMWRYLTLSSFHLLAFVWVFSLGSCWKRFRTGDMQLFWSHFCPKLCSCFDLFYRFVFFCSYFHPSAKLWFKKVNGKVYLTTCVGDLEWFPAVGFLLQRQWVQSLGRNQVVCEPRETCQGVHLFYLQQW